MNLQRVYELLQERDNRLFDYYDISKYSDFYDKFLQELGLEPNDESKISLASRLVSLRDDMISQVLKNADFTKEQIDEKKEQIYLFVRDFYLILHKELIDTLEQEELLSEFYLTYLKGIHKIGIEFSEWQIAWNREIITKINPKLLKEFDNNEKEIFEFLEDNNLLDLGHNGVIADRSYSILQSDGTKSYKSISYFDAFFEVKGIIREIRALQKKLSLLEDRDFDKKREIIEYLEALIEAFSERDVNELVSKWADVDRAWMKIDIPLQLSHPLEYYEDHFRKAVAPEFDIRIKNPNIQNSRVHNITKMYNELYSELGSDKGILNLTLQNLDKVQLYIGRIMFFYGAEFNGLFSAQVVPNDEVVSSEYGKKIFAFPDNILSSARAKPLMLLPRLIFGDEFIKVERDFLFNESEKWHKLYDITTIGHEFGHILWVDSDSESVMNKSGNYKNIEEFKATTGGLVSFFMNPEEDLEIELLRDTIKRAVNLMNWMEVDEVKPYYCEGLIHLHILFKANVLRFRDSKLKIDVSLDSYNRVKDAYIKTYKELATHYLNKKDATEFLERFCVKDALHYMPKDKEVYDFVSFYYDLYRTKGRDIDTISKESYKR